jgi:hypothetical protein
MSARYSIMPAEAFTDRRLKPVDVRVLGVLGGFMGKNAEGWPSQKTIASAAGLHRVTVNTSLKLLVELGYVKTRERSKSGMKVALHYRIVIDDEERASLVADQAELFPKDQLAPRRKPAKSDVANDYIGKGKNMAKAQQRQMSSTATSEMNDVVTVGYNDVVTGDYIQRTYPENIPVPVSSLRSETDAGPAKASQPPSKPTSRNADPFSAEKDFIFKNGVQLLVAQGCTEQTSRSFLGKLVRDWKPKPVAEAIKAAISEKIGDAKSWIPAALKKRKSELSVKAAPTPETAGADEWAAAIKGWAETGYWPSARLGLAPNQVGYRGPIKPLEELLPSLGDHPAAREIRSTINLRASA